MENRRFSQAVGVGKRRKKDRTRAFAQLLVSEYRLKDGPDDSKITAELPAGAAAAPSAY